MAGGRGQDLYQYHGGIIEAATESIYMNHMTYVFICIGYIIIIYIYGFIWALYVG